MNERIREFALQAGMRFDRFGMVIPTTLAVQETVNLEKFAKLIVDEMCGLMEQAEDDAYHLFEPSERPTEYIKWLGDWRERFAEHFGVKK